MLDLVTWFELGLYEIDLILNADVGKDVDELHVSSIERIYSSDYGHQNSSDSNLSVSVSEVRKQKNSDTPNVMADNVTASLPKVTD
ncbi:unnamed protein product [Colias eurytheme]|nr:unnamed protein product [Colias eurytheme]